MRTTLTIADDVAAMLKQEMARSGRMFRDVLNDALRAGLTNRRGPNRPEKLKNPTRVWNARLLINIDNVQEALDLVDGPWRR